MSLIPYAQAFDKLIQQLNAQNKTELVAIEEVQGRVLAASIEAQFDSPIFDNSAMDGYAICGIEQESWTLIDYVAAGDSTQHIHLKSGQAVRIFTGSAVPLGTDAVIPQENISIQNHIIMSLEPIKEKQHIRFKAEEFTENDILVGKNQIITATHIGVFASQGLTEVLCYAPLKVTVFSSGNELQSLGKELLENQIYDSNRLMLLSLLKNYSFIQYFDGGVLPDDELIIEEQLSRAEKQSDVILISGGASVGDKDYTKQVLEKIGEVQHWKLAIKPGKPFAWGKINNTKVFVLPGNPVACWVTYLILVLPALKVLSGIQPNLVLPKKIQAKAQFNTHKAQSRLQFLRGNIAIVEGQVQAFIHALQSSAMLANCANSNALVMIPENETVQHGQMIELIYLDEI
ncbi:molybdopterin molybdotransferase MoeA [Acinetobacter equi]|uniref:Molybdopterin molybdenumtransferase n=1 Tax=Acinetobacter equi TaxID=1324350 RepID=A0A0N9VET1_9GAMM|nr:molybdopterin molybdotransferase MoeA [Acinetobacter equi]ALH95728.1 hypothetical protein AOY20_09405 [Acinetobacter equi]